MSWSSTQIQRNKFLKQNITQVYMQQKTLGKIQIILGIIFLIPALISYVYFLLNSDIFFNPNNLLKEDLQNTPSSLDDLRDALNPQNFTTQTVHIEVNSGLTIILSIISTIALGVYMMITGFYNVKK